MKKQQNSVIENMSADEVQAIINRVIHLRKNVLKMSQSKFSAITNISQAYLSQIENGRKTISITILLQISANLNVNLDWLLYGTGEDQNIFTEATTSVLVNKENALSNLVKIFSLNSTDEHFLSWYLALSTAERQLFTDALSAFSHLYNNPRASK